MVTLQPEEFKLTSTGVLLNGSTALPFVDLTKISGVDSAELRTQIASRESVDGSWVDARFEKERTVVLEGTIYANPAALETYLDSLKANWAPSVTDKQLYFGTDNGTRCVFGKPQGVRYDKDSLRRLGASAAQFIMICGDPSVYSESPVVQNLPGTVTLDGNRSSYPIIRINAARTNPTLTLNGKTMTLTTDITAGYIEINVRDRTVLTGGGVNRRNVLSFSAGATWEDFKLAVGANVFTVGGTGAGTITATTYSAWR